MYKNDLLKKYNNVFLKLLKNTKYFLKYLYEYIKYELLIY